MDVAFEVASGDGLYLAQAAKMLPRHRLDRPVSPSTLFRWVRAGVVVEGGERVRLEAVRVSGRWLTSRAALARFLKRQTPSAPDSHSERSRTPSQRARAQHDAADRLRRAHGI